MSQKHDSKKLGIYASQIQGFANLNAREPFVGYDKARTHFEDCVPNHLGDPVYRSLCQILGVAESKQAAAYASNITFMQQLSRGLQQVIADEWHLNGQRELHILTVTPGDWVVSEYEPVVDLKRWRAEAQRWLKRLDVTAIAFIEATPFKNYPWSGPGRAISFHLHAICYLTDPKKFPAKLASLNAQLKTNMVLKLPAVVSKPIHQTESDVAYVSGYISKIGVSAKRVGIERNGKDRLYNAPLPKLLGLRQAEILSFLKPQELIISRGKAGQAWKASILANVGLVAIQRYPDRLTDGQLHQLWGGMRKQMIRHTPSARKISNLKRQASVCIVR